MINAVLVFNNNGQPRLTKFYTQLDTSVQQRLISEIFTLVANRPNSSCNFLPLPPLLASSSTSSTPSEPHNDVPSLVTYRHYATLYFIVISTSTESPLALLDLIQVFVESLDRLFQDVCELDLIFNFETLHAVLGEMIVGGVVIETGLERVVEGVKSQGRVAKRPVNEGRGTGGLGSGVWAGRPVLPTEAVSRWLDGIPAAPSMEVALRGGAGRRGSFPFFDYGPQRILDAVAWPFRQCLCILEVDGYANTALPKHQYPPSRANDQHWRIVQWQPQPYQLDYTPGPSLHEDLENSLPQYAQHDPRPTLDASHVVQDQAQPLSSQETGTLETTPTGHASRQGSDATLVESSVDSERQDLNTRARMMNYELRYVLERRTQILENYQRQDLHVSAGEHPLPDWERLLQSAIYRDQMALPPHHEAGALNNMPPSYESWRWSWSTMVEESQSEGLPVQEIVRVRSPGADTRTLCTGPTIARDAETAAHRGQAAAGGETGPPENDMTVEPSDRAVPDQAIVAEVQATSGPNLHLIEETQTAARASQIVSAEDSAVTTEGRLQTIATVEVKPAAAQTESRTQHSENTTAGESEPATAQGGRITVEAETPHVADSRAATTTDSQPFTVESELPHPESGIHAHATEASANFTDNTPLANVSPLPTIDPAHAALPTESKEEGDEKLRQDSGFETAAE